MSRRQRHVRRSTRGHLLACVAVATALLAAACSSADDSGSPTTTTGGTSTTSTSSTAPTTTTPSATSTTSTTTTFPNTTPTTTAPATTTTSTTTTSTTTTVPSTLIDVKLYLLRDARLVSMHRQVAGPAVLRAALTALLAGPSDTERAAGVSTTIPAGTLLLGLSLSNGLATVDLSSEFGTGGGSLSMQARVAEVVFTATQFSTVDRVVFRMNGAPITALGGEGLVLTAPQTRAMVDRTISGSVIIDTPTPGATVRRTFTVRGEGDVYEAQFPIEVWANGRQVGGVAPVTAGNMGIWRTFEVTITIDAPLGPIELVAYDAGGCGTDPECPPIIKTVVPLTLVA